jgi:hypothetical protein
MQGEVNCEPGVLHIRRKGEGPTSRLTRDCRDTRRQTKHHRVSFRKTIVWWASGQGRPLTPCSIPVADQIGSIYASSRIALVDAALPVFSG